MKDNDKWRQLFLSVAAAVDHLLPTLVALHGFTLRKARPVFAEEGSYNVLAIDLIGHGRFIDLCPSHAL